MTGRSDHFHRYLAEGNHIAVVKKGRDLPGSETECFLNDLPPVIPVRFFGIVPIQQNFDVGEGRRILTADPQGDISKEVEISEMIFVPVAEPYLVDAFLITEFFEAILVGGGIDDDSRSLDIDGITVGVSAPVETGDEPYGAKMLFFRIHDKNIGKRETWCQGQIGQWYFLDLAGDFSYSPPSICNLITERYKL
jgi:hypothetical protein